MKTNFLNYQYTLKTPAAGNCPALSCIKNTDQAASASNQDVCNSVFDKSYCNAIKSYNTAFLGKKLADNAGKPVYIIDAYGNCAKLINIEDAANKTGISQHSILQCAEGEREYVKDVTFAFAEDIEDKTPSGIRPDIMIVDLAADVIKSGISPPQTVAECSRHS